MINSIKAALPLRLNSLHQSITKLVQYPVVSFQLRQFAKADEKEKASYWESLFDADEFATRLRNSGLIVDEAKIDCADFETWLREYDELAGFYEKMGDTKIQKLLEHYLTFKHLDIKQTDVCVDIAAATSPLSRIMRKKGIRAWSQDLQFPAGINGFDIGGDAADMPVRNEFADILTLHCAFECFRGTADTRFALEAGRVLKKGGRIGIIPLYLDTIHFIKTSPYCSKIGIDVEKEARWLWRDDRWKEPFSRHYSPESFAERIGARMKLLNIRILRFTNLDELSKRYPRQRLYCHFMLKGEKLQS